MRIKKLFFDRKAVTGKVDRTTRKVLSRFGAFVRRTAKSSIRKRKRVSAVGQPPSSHSGILKKFIFFGYEPVKRNVVIGPAKLNQKIGDAPHALEHGGTSTLLRQGFGGQAVRRKKRRVKIKARPFMGPAFQKEKPKLPAMWAGSVK